MSRWVSLPLHQYEHTSYAVFEIGVIHLTFLQTFSTFEIGVKESVTSDTLHLYCKISMHSHRCNPRYKMQTRNRSEIDKMEPPFEKNPDKFLCYFCSNFSTHLMLYYFDI